MNKLTLGKLVLINKCKICKLLGLEILFTLFLNFIQFKDFFGAKI